MLNMELKSLETEKKPKKSTLKMTTLFGKIL